jgi:hypothetical protein
MNDSGLFLDDASLGTVRESVPVPIEPSYDFIDILSAPEVVGAMLEAR